MGFKITVNYDKSVLSSPKVIAGEITQNGMMNDSVGATPEGIIDVVWSGTQNVTGDGTLFVISFTALKTAETKVTFSYSQPDTFNEAWEDVELNLTDVTVRITNEKVTVNEEPISHSVNQTEGRVTAKPNTEQIKDAVEIVLNEEQKENISDIPEEERQEFVDRVNEVIGSLNGTNEEPFENPDLLEGEYKEAVKEEFVDDVLASFDGDKIEQAVNDSLEAVGSETVEQIPEEKKSEFVQKVEENLRQHAPDLDTVSDKLSDDEAVELIGKLQISNAEAVTQGMKLPEQQKESDNTATVIIVVATIAFAAITTIIVVYIKKKSKNEEAK